MEDGARRGSGLGLAVVESATGGRYGRGRGVVAC
jgi:hypothetical protein